MKVPHVMDASGGVVCCSSPAIQMYKSVGDARVALGARAEVMYIAT
jgi:hypothetical protein